LTTLTALGILVLDLVAFVTNVWFGVALLSVMVAGALVAAAIAFCHRNPTVIRQDPMPLRALIREQKDS